MRRYFVIFLIGALSSIWLITHGEAYAMEKPAEFSGDVVITTPESTIKAKIYVKDPYIRRVEMSKEEGGMIFISPPEALGSIWMLDPEKKQYSILSWPERHKDPVQAWTDIQYDMGGGPVGEEEVINGYSCTIYHFKYPDQDKIALKMWLAEDLLFAIKREADAEITVEKDADPVPVQGTFEVLNIKTETLDDALFEVPSDYKEVK
ncbi:MAG: DUF4412 domain-containing protein [Deltaproteobacteria bacterium]|nr:DUF4412 domain-containing protein [Deltaproteobacteria bacterium]